MPDSVAREQVALLEKRVAALEAQMANLGTVITFCKKVLVRLSALRKDLRLLPEFARRIPPVGELPLAIESLLSRPIGIEDDRIRRGLVPGRDF